jgi:hypothetical protein
MSASWPPGKVAAVSLTFDGGTRSQFDSLRVLADLGLRATLYLDAPTFLDNLSACQDLANEGVELGNLALQGATDEDGLIARMPAETVADEVLEMKRLLLGMFDRRHSAAMPLVKVFTGESGLPIIPQVVHRSIVRLNDDLLGGALRDEYDTIRSSHDGFNGLESVQELRCYRGDSLDAVALGLVTQIAISQGQWLILSFGPGADPSAVRMFARWLVRQPVWSAPVIEIADWLAEANHPHPTYDSL